MANEVLEPMHAAPSGSADGGAIVDPVAVGAATAAGERAARLELRRQIARLEQRLGELEAEGVARPRTASGASRSAPRIATLGELESTRDSLAGALADGRRVADRRAAGRERTRAILERAIASPGEHRWLRVRSDALGEPGCKHWHVKPRFGLIGILTGWWRVKVSSGCPLACRA